MEQRVCTSAEGRGGTHERAALVLLTCSTARLLIPASNEVRCFSRLCFSTVLVLVLVVVCVGRKHASSHCRQEGRHLVGLPDTCEPEEAEPLY
jgi:hypothetical protein